MSSDVEKQTPSAELGVQGGDLGSPSRRFPRIRGGFSLGNSGMGAEVTATPKLGDTGGSCATPAARGEGAGEGAGGRKRLRNRIPSSKSASIHF